MSRMSRYNTYRLVRLNIDAIQIYHILYYPQLSLAASTPAMDQSKTAGRTYLRGIICGISHHGTRKLLRPYSVSSGLLARALRFIRTILGPVHAVFKHCWVSLYERWHLSALHVTLHAARLLREPGDPCNSYFPPNLITPIWEFDYYLLYLASRAPSCAIMIYRARLMAAVSAMMSYNSVSRSVSMGGST
jgi:hypothetical protein